MNTIKIVASLISEDINQISEFYAAVACVEHYGRWLLGLSKSDDDRKGHWCFPGGGIKGSETPHQGAVRECWEETGVKCKAFGGIMTLDSKPGVAFVYCKALGMPFIKHNHEFSDMRFLSLNEMSDLKLYPNVLKLIRMC